MGRIDIRTLIDLLRMKQWYKNAVIFIPLFFSKLLFEINYYPLLLLTFLSLSLISSAGYIFNDILDLEKDRQHPVKRKRPLPSGKISITTAIIIMLVLIFLSLIISIEINILLTILILALFVNTVIYTLFFKHVTGLDIAFLSLNFIIRILAGTVVLNVSPSYWLIVTTYFVAIMLSASKRYGEILRGNDTRKVLKEYDKQVILGILIASGISLFLFYLLYLHTSPTIKHKTIVTAITLPLSVTVIIRWIVKSVQEPDIAEDVTKIFTDLPFISSLLLWALVLFIFIYYPY